ncbi:helix-turn-helix domain-containing protein [Isoptericola sp. b441]|uniref:Helix-turn-helix domain-containing protein n=1 Tax=Actinotalea lenta TaxID=3064654 RepID=A0ABT9D869_9CELL|nr:MULTISPECIES: TetR/AcrR family transcriptional regulator [unclassified Isoptericola]MDO8107074.1 helix-turn-helix domain-containing protein [Isoptericola sp. b441]MDO8121212.1 helix-turn-helix domain-containing protein [Isoptericola sp. b490]
MTELDARPDTPRRARTRERLMDAAFEVFGEQGLAATSVEQIAERAGFTRGAFYSNFSSKEELLLALMARDKDQWLTSLSERVGRLFPTGGSAVTEDEIGAAVAGLIAGPFEHRQWLLVQNEFRLLALRDPELARAYAAHRAGLEDSLVHIVEQALARARRRLRIDARSMVRVVTALYQDTLERAMLSGEEGESLTPVHTELARLLAAITDPG